jgi:tripartite-type tricarboxylate transporter receptor subunit TctC
MGRFHYCGLAAVAVATIATSQLPAAPVYAQTTDYPRRAITFMVGFAPGGGIDTFARVVAQELTEQAGFSVVIENRAGAASNIAAKAVAGAPPDGYTLLFTSNRWGHSQLFSGSNNLLYLMDIRSALHYGTGIQSDYAHGQSPT